MLSDKLLHMQWRQLNHDELYHREIARLSVGDKMKHMTGCSGDAAGDPDAYLEAERFSTEAGPNASLREALRSVEELPIVTASSGSRPFNQRDTQSGRAKAGPMAFCTAFTARGEPNVRKKEIL